MYPLILHFSLTSADENINLGRLSRHISTKYVNLEKMSDLCRLCKSCLILWLYCFESNNNFFCPKFLVWRC
jgi:hypothetical protein